MAFNQFEKIGKTSKKKTLGTFPICMAVTLLLVGSYCHARRVSLEGVGISIRYTDKIYRYKSDHLDTASWDLGVIFPRTSVPSQVVGKEFATHDFRPASEDSRTNDHIERIKADATGDLLIAMPSDAATGEGWVRLNSQSTPDYYLDKIGQNTSPYPDSNSPYWFYTHPYTTPGTWVSLPVNSISTDHPPFVFANKGELYWENPPVLPGAVTIATKPEGGGNTTVANPSMLIMPNGDYLACASGTVDASGTGLWKSVDKGASWTLLADGFSLNRQSIFEHQGNIYLIGGKTRIYKSSDNGKSWTFSDFSGSYGYDAPSHVDIANGRIWKAATADIPGGTAPGFFSAPIGADLMSESNWTPSAPGATWGAGYGEYALANGQKAEVKYESEGTLLRTKEGQVVIATKSNIYRPEDGWKEGIAMICADQSDITKTKVDADYAGPRLPGSTSKYTVRYDSVSNRYWALTSGGINRGELNLYSASSEDGRIGDFQFERRILEGHSTSYHGFNYPFMQIDGNDIVFVLRTAWDHHRGTSDRWHDADLFTFHRIKNFRDNSSLLVHEGFEGMTLGQPLGQQPGLGIVSWSGNIVGSSTIVASESFGSYYTGAQAVRFDKDANATRSVIMIPSGGNAITSNAMYVSYLVNVTIPVEYGYDNYIGWRTPSALGISLRGYVHGSPSNMGIATGIVGIGNYDNTGSLIGNGTFMIVNKFDGLGTAGGRADIWAIDARAYDIIAPGGITEAELNANALLHAFDEADATDITWQDGEGYEFLIGADAIVLLDEVKIGTTLSAVVERAMYGDFNGDGVVNLDDLRIFAAVWLEDDCVQTVGIDIDGDCFVDMHEFSQIAKNGYGYKI